MSIKPAIWMRMGNKTIERSNAHAAQLLPRSDVKKDSPLK